MTDHKRQEHIVSEVLKILPELGKGVVDTLSRDIDPKSASPAQLKVVVHLAEYGPLTMGRLAEGLAITTPSATGLVNPLADSGMVERERDPSDRRVVNVRLSADAQQMADKILAVRRRGVAEALEGMDLAAQEHLVEGLRRLSAAVVRGNGGNGPPARR